MDKEFLNNEDFVNKKITEYSKEIAEEFYQTVSRQFKRKILEKFGYYRSITPEFLDGLLEGSDFQDLCFSDIGFTMRKNDLFWVASLEKSFIELIDFKALRDYEDSTFKNTEIRNVNNDSLYSVGKQYKTTVKYSSQIDISHHSTIADSDLKNYFFKFYSRQEEKRKNISQNNIINSYLKEKSHDNIITLSKEC